MTAYTKAYISQLLDKFMAGTSTIEEEDILSQYFAQGQVPAEWEDYRLLFSELEEMKEPKTTAKPIRRRAGWGVAAAVGALTILFATTQWQSSEQEALMADRQTVPTAQEPLASQADTTTTSDVLYPEAPNEERLPDTTAIREKYPKATSKKRRSLRKPEPTITDYDKAALLMAEAELEEQEVERQIEQVRMELIHQRMVDAGYVAVTLEDGTVLYINEPNEFFAYEE